MTDVRRVGSGERCNMPIKKPSILFRMLGFLTKICKNLTLQRASLLLQREQLMSLPVRELFQPVQEQERVLGQSSRVLPAFALRPFCNQRLQMTALRTEALKE